MGVAFSESGGNLGPPDGRDVPRFMGPSTFARLPGPSEVGSWDVAVVGVRFDAGTSYRPGARFGPQRIRAESKRLRPHHPALRVQPFHDQQVVDVGDIIASPYSIEDAVAQIERGASELLEAAPRFVTLGERPHDCAAAAARGQPQARSGGPRAFRRAPRHVGHLHVRAVHPRHTVSTRYRGGAVRPGPIDARRNPRLAVQPGGPLGGRVARLRCDRHLEIEVLGIAGVVTRIREQIGDRPLYVSIDIDVLDPAFAPGTGTPENGGFSSRKLAGILRGLAGLDLVGVDVVEVAPAYDHAEVTSIAAANMAYELLALMASRRAIDAE
jgi:agmatinase